MMQKNPERMEKMAKKHIGLMGAMDEEVARLYARMTDRSEESVGGVTFYTGTLAGRRVTLCCAGMGKVNAACAAQLLILKFGAQALIFSGIAGNMTDKIGVGDVVIGKTLLYHDAERRMIADTFPHLQEFHGDSAMIEAAEAACDEAGVRYLVGKIATGDDFVGDSATKNAIAAKCAPDCVEMEGAAVAHVAAKYEVPCVVLRAMSDNADENAYETLVVKEFDITEYCDTAARICEGLIRRLAE